VSTIYTVADYCEAEKISRSKLYQEWKRGEGVEFLKRGKKIYITDEARLEYRQKLLQRTRGAAK
jgi:hypothetical protein